MILYFQYLILFYKYSPKNYIIKRPNEKINLFFLILNGSCAELNLIIKNECLTEEEYIKHLIKMNILKEKEIIKRCLLYNKKEPKQIPLIISYNYFLLLLKT